MTPTRSTGSSERPGPVDRPPAPGRDCYDRCGPGGPTAGTLPEDRSEWGAGVADGAARPQWERLREALLQGIESGRWPVGGTLPTEAEMSRSFGVSRITVRRALNELRAAGLVETARGRRTRVLRAIPEPAPAAAPDSLQGLRVVHFTVPWLANENVLAMMRGVEGELRGRGCTAVMTCSDNDPERERRQALLSHRLGVAGLIVYPAQGWTNAEVFRHLAGRQLPLVYVGRYHPDVPADRVVADNVGGADAAVAFLLDRGHRRIAFVNGAEREVSAVADRLQGYCRAHERHGLAVDFRLVLMDLFAENPPQSAVSERIAALWGDGAPTAALAVNGPAAAALARHLRALGLPCEIAAFTGAGDPEPVPGLAASLPVPAEAMGRETAAIVARRIAGDWEDWPLHRVVPVELHPAAADPLEAPPVPVP